MDSDEPLLVTGSGLVRDFNDLGVRPGGVVMLHASVKSVGWVVGGPDVILHALREALGPDGTLMMYVGWDDKPYEMGSWPEARRRAYLEECPPFDPATSRAVIGVVHPDGVPQDQPVPAAVPTPRSRWRPSGRRPPGSPQITRSITDSGRGRRWRSSAGGRRGPPAGHAVRFRDAAPLRRVPGRRAGQADRPLPDAGPRGRPADLGRCRGVRHHRWHPGLGRGRLLRVHRRGHTWRPVTAGRAWWGRRGRTCSTPWIVLPSAWGLDGADLRRDVERGR